MLLCDKGKEFIKFKITPLLKHLLKLYISYIRLTPLPFYFLPDVNLSYNSRPKEYDVKLPTQYNCICIQSLLPFHHYVQEKPVTLKTGWKEGVLTLKWIVVKNGDDEWKRRFRVLNSCETTIMFTPIV